MNDYGELASRANVPDYIVEVLMEWHDGLKNDLPLTPDRARLADKVHYWLYGDEAGEPVPSLLPPQERAWVFTFGADHHHPSPDKKHHSLLGYCVQIKAQTETDARERMISLFGHEWSRCYHYMEEATKQDKYSLTDLTNELIPEEWRP